MALKAKELLLYRLAFWRIENQNHFKIAYDAYIPSILQKPQNYVTQLCKFGCQRLSGRVGISPALELLQTCCAFDLFYVFIQTLPVKIKQNKTPFSLESCAKNV